ncbi:hypothetical protein GCM10010193_52360 [Kitasatospora atroaurantiaca]|uniref:nuclear transport factor 2 family protein n=1 Tax=Kitasatospora atroaurantiaca TaxID=285545 RepID=UPI0011A94D2D|nr:nuclear transport factor 2 family protein [Kitasatospora atroaurantiaca]
MEDESVANFAQEWFDELSHHEPVERLLARIAETDLEMAFPERTLYSHADFADWYEAVGKAFADQSHTVEKLRADHRGDLVDVAVTVVWSATQTADGTRSAFRVNQSWQLRKEPGQRLRIVKYRVGTLDRVPVDGRP